MRLGVGSVVIGMSGRNHILVTGATGFIGSHVVKGFVERGFDVSVVTRRMPSEPIEAEVHVIDTIARRHDWDGIVDGIGVVVHLAGRAHRRAEV